MESIGLLSWDRLESCHGIEWTLVIGSIGVLSWDRLESCHGINWSLVMGSIEVLSWDRFKAPKRSWTNSLASGWWRASGLLSWDGLKSCHGIDSSPQREVGRTG